MNARSLFADDDAVSPVIGVILMVAVTVILAAVIGAFVLGIGSQVTGTTPTVSVGFDYNGTSNVTISHGGGDSVGYDSLSVSVDGSSYESGASGWSATGSEFAAGESITVNGSFSSGDEVLLIYSRDDGGGGSTAILAEGEIP